MLSTGASQSRFHSRTPWAIPMALCFPRPNRILPAQNREAAGPQPRGWHPRSGAACKPVNVQNWEGAPTGVGGSLWGLTGQPGAGAIYKDRQVLFMGMAQAAMGSHLWGWVR